MEQAEEVSRMTVPVPLSIKRALKVNAARADRTLSKEIVRTLRAGIAKMESEQPSQ